MADRRPARAGRLVRRRDGRARQRVEQDGLRYGFRARRARRAPRGPRPHLGGQPRFTEGLGCYDRVLTYDEVSALPVDGGIVFVDMAGMQSCVSPCTNTRGCAARSIMVGATHWETASLAAEGLPGPTPEFFFAPTRIEQRAVELGQSEFNSAWAQRGRRSRSAFRSCWRSSPIAVPKRSDEPTTPSSTAAQTPARATSFRCSRLAQLSPVRPEP